jgi:hypothetical protein
MIMERTVYGLQAIKERLHNDKGHHGSAHHVVELVAKDGQDLEVWFDSINKRYEICLGCDDDWVMETKLWSTVVKKLRQLDVEVA